MTIDHAYTDLEVFSEGNQQFAVAAGRDTIDVFALPTLRICRQISEGCEKFDISCHFFVTATQTAVKVICLHSAQVLREMCEQHSVVVVCCAEECIAIATLHGHLLMTWGHESAVRLSRGRIPLVKP